MKHTHPLLVLQEGKSIIKASSCMHFNIKIILSKDENVYIIMDAVEVIEIQCVQFYYF